ncbi:MAG: glutaredoxin family protein [Chromatiaceae bacterium]|nr:glutaredoxin family protein [Chromatiaceae bacterium]MCP5445092.1 glutaredoxin family protein [Chromatiaceae bacterium]
MWQHLRDIQTERNFELVRVDVDSHSVLQARFGALVPVLIGGDRIICNYYLDPVALDRYLAGIV